MKILARILVRWILPALAVGCGRPQAPAPAYPHEFERLRQADAGVRAEAAHRLFRAGEPGLAAALDRLRDLARTRAEADAPETEELLYLMGDARYRPAAAELGGFLKHPAADVRIAALSGIAELRDVAAIPLLRAHAASAAGRERYMAGRALCELREPEGLSIVIGSLDGEDTEEEARSYLNQVADVWFETREEWQAWWEENRGRIVWAAAANSFMTMRAGEGGK